GGSGGSGGFPDSAVPDAAPSDAPRPDGSTSGDAGVQSPIRHVIVIVKENHTFDNYFGSFPRADVAPSTRRPHRHVAEALCHTRACALTNWAGGAMTGWTDSLATQQYTEADIPNYWQYARHFVLADHFFASELGPSFPGHSLVLSAQAAWATDNPSQTTP